MKLRNKLLLSALIGFCAMLLSTTPMWWGVLFSPISQQLTSAPVTEDTSGGVCWEEDGTVLRFKSLDLLFSFLHPCELNNIIFHCNSSIRHKITCCVFFSPSTYHK